MERDELNKLVESYTSSINEVYRHVTVIMKEKVHQELTTDQFATMHYLYLNEPSTSTDIANEFAIGKSAVTAQINRLFEKGFIERKRDENDRRVVYLYLTDEGKRLVEQGMEKLYEVLGEVLNNFDKKEIYFFIEKLQRLAHLLKNYK
jgi:DNA-binding MarR family transcriptional regulator